MRYSRLHRCWLVSPALAMSLFAALAAFPAFAQGGAATLDEMERAKAALAEALKREQAGGGDRGPGLTDTAPSSASPAAATVTPGSEGPKPPSEVTVAPEPPAEATVPITIAPPPPSKYPTAARSLANAPRGTPLAVRQGASEIYTVGAGRSRWARAGAEAPIEVRVLYKGLTGYEACP